MNAQNDIYEQLTSNKAQLTNVRETLTHISEMEVWEVKEYQAVEADYIARIAELEALITEYEAVTKTPVTGYTVEAVNGENIAYKLHGTRGAEYRLVRHINHPELMFCINSNGNVCGLKGNYTFSDQSGELLPYYG